MNHRLNSTRSILFVFGLLTSGNGCQVLNIPSYRVDSANGLSVADAAGYRSPPCETGAPEGACALDEGCPPTFLPPQGALAHCGLPVPAWYVKWRTQRDLPEPAPYPHFHPLPTRPMFQPQPNSGPILWGESPTATMPYGQLPAAGPKGRLEGSGLEGSGLEYSGRGGRPEAPPSVGAQRSPVAPVPNST